jgi:hypothetical protein
MVYSTYETTSPPIRPSPSFDEKMVSPMEFLSQRVQQARANIHVSPHVAAEGVCKKSFISHILYNRQNILNTNNPPYEPYILTIFYQT